MQNSISVERAIFDITQEELAGQIGVSRQTINSIEKNRYVPSTILALRISAYFNKTVNELFILDEDDYC
ncbi:MAG: transcriptional regulator [Bacteroidetes bacterium]|nr:MAG: transcriptional regulator [Bacteroidota bacterium]